MKDEAERDLNSKPLTEQEEWETLIASYALGGVTTAEAERARNFIAHDAEAARLYEEFVAATAILPEIYADTEMVSAQPSAALKGRVIAAARAEMHGAPQSDPTPLPIAATRTRKGVPLWSGWLAAAALLIAVIGLGAWNLNLHQDVQQANRDRDIVRFAASGVHAYTMAGTQNAPNANATLIESSAEGGRVVLLAQGFPNAQTGQTYRVWLQKQDGSYIDVGTFGGGSGETKLVLPGNLNDVHAVIITAEPETRPATRPTGKPVMEGELRV